MSVFFPTEYISHMTDYDFGSAYRKGKRLILFDIDNTIVPHNAPADDKAIKFIARLKDMGFKLYCISNNRLERVEPFALATGIDFIYHAGKPARKSLDYAMMDAQVSPDETIFFGDQIFTDILAANHAGIDSVLVRPIDISAEPPRFIWKRFFEWPIVSLLKIIRKPSVSDEEKKVLGG